MFKLLIIGAIVICVAKLVEEVILFVRKTPKPKICSSVVTAQSLKAMAYLLEKRPKKFAIDVTSTTPTSADIVFTETLNGYRKDYYFFHGPDVKGGYDEYLHEKD